MQGWACKWMLFETRTNIFRHKTHNTRCMQNTSCHHVANFGSKSPFEGCNFASANVSYQIRKWFPSFSNACCIAHCALLDTMYRCVRFDGPASCLRFARWPLQCTKLCLLCGLLQLLVEGSVQWISSCSRCCLVQTLVCKAFNQYSSCKVQLSATLNLKIS